MAAGGNVGMGQAVKEGERAEEAGKRQQSAEELLFYLNRTLRSGGERPRNSGCRPAGVTTTHDSAN